MPKMSPLKENLRVSAYNTSAFFYVNHVYLNVNTFFCSVMIICGDIRSIFVQLEISTLNGN